MKAFSTLIGGTAFAALLAASALASQGAGQAQRQPQPQPRPQSQSQPRPAAPRPEMGARQLLPATQALFDGYVATNKMPGVVGAFGVGDLPTVFVSAGRIGDEPAAAKADPDSLWRVYSMTKPITGIAAMILMQEGKLKLDQPLSDFFPGFKTMKVLTSPDTSLDSVPAKSQITIRELLTHSAGLGYSIVVKGPLLKEYERLGILPLAASAQTEVQMRAVRPKTLAEFAERVSTLPLIAQPGTKWSYSIGLDVMGAVIEKASGMPFDRFVQTRIFDPLKMNSSYWSVPDSAASRLASNYAFVGDTRVPLDPAATSVFRAPPSFPYGGAGLVMSARDYDRFLHMLQDGGTLDGVQVLTPQTAALAMSNLLPNGVTFPGAVAATGGSTNPMGFGAGGSVAIADTPGGVSKGTYGWGGAAGTIAWVDPVRHMRGTVMVNYFPAEKWPLRSDVRVSLVKDMARYGQ